MTFTTEVNLKDFEQYLCVLTDNNQLQYRSIKENGATLHLYYNDYGHVGTWQAPGHGVVFDHMLFIQSQDEYDDLRTTIGKASRVVNKNGNLGYKIGVNI